MKSTYSAVVRIPSELTARMSGNLTSEITQGDTTTYEFRSDIPTASYLIAIVAGEIEIRQVGPRTYVTAEPGFIEESVRDLSNLEDALISLENYTFPYAWGTYNIVIMP